MPTPIRHPVLAMVGLGVIAVLCVQLLRNAVTLETAAQRAVLTVLVLAVVDRLAVPIGRAMLSSSGTLPSNGTLSSNGTLPSNGTLSSNSTSGVGTSSPAQGETQPVGRPEENSVDRRVT